jgi:endonuclease/exonuclease/phosphatase family metal-dependent hydrolase
MAPRMIRIMSYNVRYFGHALRGLASTRRSKRGIARALAAIDPAPDIICLQEVDTISLRSSVAYRRAHPGQTQLESFMTELERAFDGSGQKCPYEAFYFRAHAYKLAQTPLYTTGLAVLVDRRRLRVERHNVESPQHITHHRVERWKDAKQTRICAHIELLADGGRRFHIFNTHLSLPSPFTKEFWKRGMKMGFGKNQVHEARSLAGFIKVRAGDEPYLLCGDFNSSPGSPVFHYLTEDAGITCAQLVLGHIDGAPRTFPTAGVMRLRMHLDHLFSGNGVEWVDLDGTARFGDRTAPFHALSDHVPLIGRFKLP